MQMTGDVKSRHSWWLTVTLNASSED